MSKTVNHQVFPEVLASFDGEPASFRRTFEAIAQQVPCTRVLLVSTFPRGGTQILQPSGLPEGLVRAYGKGLLASDGPTWQSILKNAPVADDDCFPASDSLQSSEYFRELMEPNGLARVAAASLPGPLFLGYPAALHVYRRADEPAFSAEDLRKLGQAAQQLGRAAEALRDTRVRNSCGVRPVWEHVTCWRQFIFDRQGRQVPLYQHRKPMPPQGVDEELRGEIRKLVSQCLEHVNGEHVQSDRVELADGNGEVWAFRAIVHREFPALGSGPYVFLCLQPSACEWQTVKQGDFAADAELARLVPTLRFMQQEFHRSPTLDEIAEKAHLSPFHFHRRFTELLGQTPKHFLLACQIQQAKRMLMERKHALSNIASECGFAHQSHFTSRFKQATGLTPTRWRRFATDLENGARAGSSGNAAESAQATSIAAQAGCVT
jgi:AraC-like DNA-binding protein